MARSTDARENLDLGSEEQLSDEEKKLAQQLKRICYPNGQEKQPKESAKIFHKLGNIYRKRSPDKFNLIRSAGLFNAAITRNPENVDEIKQDLEELISHVLIEANAAKQDVNLIAYAKTVEKKLKSLRKLVNKKLRFIKQIPNDVEENQLFQLEQNKIDAIKQLQEDIAKHYKAIMADVADKCEEVMGKKPCDYSLTAMGSLARKEITPFSDFENIILLEERCKEEDKIYFRWFALIFQIILINLQETQIPCLAIPSLNDVTTKDGMWFYDKVTTRGVSFDGMVPYACKGPLGRPQREGCNVSWELIKPVGEMLVYLNEDVALKTGYHLKDMLTSTCFVTGNKNIHEEFYKGVVNKMLETKPEDTLMEVKKQLEENIEKFNLRSALSQVTNSKTINIKRVVYRSITLFISALGRIHKIQASSCFDIITELHSMNEIEDHAKRKLSFAVASACEARLRVYMKKQSQDDLIENYANFAEKNESLMSILGPRATINTFQIAYALQCHICKEVGMQVENFYANLQLINIKILFILGLQRLTKQLLQKPLENSFAQNRLRTFDSTLRELEDQTSKHIYPLYCTISSYGATRKKTGEQLQEKAHEAELKEIYDEAQEFLKHHLRYLEKTPETKEKEKAVDHEQHR